jgi:hypothetical protein
MNIISKCYNKSQTVQSFMVKKMPKKDKISCSRPKYPLG